MKWTSVKRGWFWKLEGTKHQIERFVTDEGKTRFLVWDNEIIVNICDTVNAAKLSPK